MLLRADSAGAWSTALPLDLPDGTYTLKARARRDGEPAGQDVSVPLTWPTPTLASMRGVFPAGEASGLGIDFLTGAALKKDAGLYFGHISGLPGLSFSRASAAMRINAAGAYESVPAHTLRFDYDPVTLAPRGALLEPASINHVWTNTGSGGAVGNPGTLPTNWHVIILASGLSWQVAGFGSEDGIRYTDLRVSGTMTAASGGFGIWTINYFAAASASYYAASAFVALAAGSLAGVQASACTLNLRTNTGGNVSTGTAEKIFTLAAGRLSSRRVVSPAVLTGANTAYGQELLYFPCIQGQPVDFTVRIGLPQVDNVRLVTSPIETPNGYIQRAADALTLPSSIPWSWEVGAVVVEAMRPAPSAGDTNLLFASGGPSRVLSLTHRASNQVYIYQTDSVSSSAVLAANAVAEGSVFKAAVGWDASKFYLCLNGGAVVSLDRLAFTGFYGVNVGPDYGGYIRKLGVFTRCPSSSELQALAS